MRLRIAFFAVALAPLALGAQEEPEVITGKADAGRRLYYAAALGTNGLSCAHCHADFDEAAQDDGLIRAGHSLYGAASRPNWWGREPDQPNAYPNIGAAAAVCVEHFMRQPDRLNAQQLVDLRAYLRFINRKQQRQSLALSSGADRTGEYLGYEEGNRIRGRELFYAACHSCHPNARSGIGPALPADREPAFYARKVREGDGLGAQIAGLDPNAYDPNAGLFMPFFAVDRLSNQQLSDIIAYLRSLPPPEPPAKPKGRAAPKR
jgi:cytochrome c553